MAANILFFSGLYCSITHLHVYQCQPASLMNTQQLFIYSELEDQQVATPTYSLFWRQTYSLVLTKFLSLDCSYWYPLYYDQTNTIESSKFYFIPHIFHKSIVKISDSICSAIRTYCRPLVFSTKLFFFLQL